MKNKLLIGSLILLLLFGCQPHEHTWTDVTCTEPKTCHDCGTTEGEALGHDWSEATCTEPRTCLRCGITEGDAPGHDWSEATCTAPRTCLRCRITEGDALGHDWLEATCTAPRTCLRCGITEGEALGHAFTGTDCTSSGVCARCGETSEPLGHDWMDANCILPKTCRRCRLAEGSALGHRIENNVCAECGYTVYEPYKGSGNAVLQNVQTNGAISRVHLIHRADTDFTVWAYDADGKADLLVCIRGSYDGSVLLFGKAPYTFEVFSRTDWSLTIEQPDVMTDDAISGSGDAVTDLCMLTSGTFRITHAGEDAFAVWLYTTDGETLLVHEQGVCTAECAVNVPHGSLAFFAIRADGAWTIERIGDPA